MRAALTTLAVALYVLMGLAPAAVARPHRFDGYVAGAATGKGTAFVVGDGLYLVFRDSYRSFTPYRVCWTRGAGKRCWRSETGRRNRRAKIFAAAPSSVGTYRTTWYVSGHQVASWNFFNGVGD